VGLYEVKAIALYVHSIAAHTTEKFVISKVQDRCPTLSYFMMSSR